MYAEVIITGVDHGVQAMMLRMETALSPVIIGGFLQSTVDPYIRGRAKSRFANEGDDVSGKWLPLKEVTQKIRADSGYGAAGPINIRTGELEQYITGTPGGVMPNVSGATLTSPGSPPSGELLKKVQTAQVGQKNPNTAPRPVMGVNAADLSVILIDLSKFIVTRVAR